MNYESWIHDDKTWCANECNYFDCSRNPVNMSNPIGIHSYANFENTDLCEKKSAEKYGENNI